MTKALRGVNLGGWLVAERWMTPDLFEGVTNDGEISLVKELGYAAARRRIIQHRDTFITEADFKWIADKGFDFVRLPVGYWLFAETDDFIDGEHYLRQAFAWAETHGLGVVLDFHGLQGSQNGKDHSGQVGKVRLYRGSNKRDSLNTLAYLCRTYGRQESLLAIELMNEPKVRWFLGRLLRYYDRAYRVAEQHLSPHVRIIVSDAFKPLRMARALSRRGYGDRLILDVHLYQVFSRHDKQLSLAERIKKVEGEWSSLLDKLSGYQSVMVGEWSAALPAADQADAVVYYHAQLTCFDAHSWAHCYWSYKAPGQGSWDYRSVRSIR